MSRELSTKEILLSRDSCHVLARVTSLFLFNAQQHVLSFFVVPILSWTLTVDFLAEISDLKELCFSKLLRSVCSMVVLKINLPNGEKASLAPPLRTERKGLGTLLV